MLHPPLLRFATLLVRLILWATAASKMHRAGLEPTAPVYGQCLSLNRLVIRIDFFRLFVSVWND